MSQLVVVEGNDNEIIIRLNGRGGSEYRLVEDVKGDIAFILRGTLRPYRFEPDILFADKHQLMMMLEEGHYKSFKTKGNVKFVCRGLQDASLRWSAGSSFTFVYIAVDKQVLAQVKPDGTPGKIKITGPGFKSTVIPQETRMSDAFVVLMETIALRYRA